MIRGLAVNPPDVGGTVPAVALAAPAPLPTLTLSPVLSSAQLSSSIALTWRALFGASAVRAVLEAWPAVRLSSFIRSPAHNAKVGGRANSYHLSGLAADFVVPASDRARFVGWLRMKFPRGCDIVDEGDHIHVEWTDVKGTPLAYIIAAAALVIVGAVVVTR